MEKTICELFAGVGGFRLGFDNANRGWETVWFSQWEPGAKKQWAHDCYVKHFGDSKDINGEFHTGEDIATVNKNFIPDHTLLVGGFPCQDYSVAHSLSSSKGIEGKKGVLWWQIFEILKAKKPKFCLFENVDRLLKSPAKQRGRDFGIILSSLRHLGYMVEWRVINAADYGAAQKRRRTFIFAASSSTEYVRKIFFINPSPYTVIKDGVMGASFPIKNSTKSDWTTISDDIASVSDSFSFNFMNAGLMTPAGDVYTVNVEADTIGPVRLGDVLETGVDEKYYLKDDELPKWQYLKGPKRINRTSKNGHQYVFSEGAISFPDNLDSPGRTMLTSEGTTNRSSHIVKDKETDRLRRITPKEAERLQGFNDDWTKDTTIGEMPDRMRYFCMGNALVVPMITRLAETISNVVEKEN